MKADSNPRSNPFPGLRPFRTEEHHLFFGREEQTAALLALLRENRFLAIVGTSGSGKSSLVRAGLIPALHRGSMARAGTSWEVVVLRPGGHPVTSLARALLEAELYEAKDPEELPRLRATLSRSLHGLTEAVRQSAALDPETNLLVVVDQFEELFRFREQGVDSEEAATAFVNLLLSAAQAEDRRIYVAITMRSDYLGDCAQIPGLAEAVNRGEYLIPRLTRDQRRDAIEKPVGVGGARIAPRLVQHMLNDVGDDPDQLPVLQHALMRTWDAWALDHADGEPVDLRHYEATGGMAEALSRHADEIFAALPDDSHRAAADRAFKALTVKGSDNRGIRRPTRLARLAQIVGASEKTVQRVVDAYRQPGVTFLMPGLSTELDAGTVIDLSHESLMRVWRRLSVWVDEEAQSARIYRRLAETAALWERKEAGLYHDPDLQIARTWRDSMGPNEAWADQYGGGLAGALVFLDQSRHAAEADERAREAARARELEQAKRLAEAERRRLELQKRTARRLRVFAAGLACVAALAIGAFFFAMAARREAVSNAQLAARSEETAKKAAKELERTLVQSDFEQGVKYVDAGESAEGLPHLARALRTDPTFAPAALRTMSTLSSGRFALKTFPPLQQQRIITNYFWNEKEDLLFTSDQNNDIEEPERYVWDARTGQRLYRLGQGEKLMRTPTWTEDGSLLVAYFEGKKTVQVWEARTGKELSPIVTDKIDSFRLGQHPEAGQLILVRYQDWSMRVYYAATGKPVGGPGTPRLERPAPSRDFFGFTPDGRRVFGVCSDASIAVWDALTGTLVNVISTRPYRTPDASGSDHRGGVFFSADSAFLVARADDGKHVSWWRVGESNPVTPWLELPDITEVFFLPGGGKLALVTRGQTTPLRIGVHDLATGAETAHIETPRPVGFVFWPDGNRGIDLGFPILGAVDANIIRVWDLETGGPLREIFTPWLLVWGEMSPEGRRVLTMSTADDLMLWDLLTGQPLWSEALKIKAGRINFSPDGQKLVLQDMARRVVEIRDSRTARPLREPIEQISLGNVLFPLAGRRALLWESQRTSMGNNFIKQTTGRFHLLDLGLRPQLFEPLLDGVGSGNGSAGQFTPDGSLLVAVGKQTLQSPQEIIVFDAGQRRLLRSMPMPPEVYVYVTTLNQTPDGRRVVIGCSDSRVRVFDLARGEVLHELLHERPVMSTAISADGALIATGSDQGKLRVWDLSSGAPLFEPVEQGDQPLLDLAFSPDGTLLASASRDFKMRLAESRSGKPRFEPLAFENVLQQVAFSPDGTHLVGVPFQENLPIIEVATGEVVRKLHHSDACRTYGFSHDGSMLAISTGADFNEPVGQVTLWAWREGRRMGRPLDTRGSVGKLEFSKDDALLVTGTLLPTGGSVQVWDVASGLAVTDQVVGRTGVSTVAFRPGAAEVVATWQDGTIRVIDLPSRAGVASEKLAQLADAVAGKRIVSGKGGVEDVPREELERLRAGPDPGWWQWFFSEADDRTISPGSKMTLRDYLARLRKSSVLADLQDALSLAPDDGLTHARIGLVLLDELASKQELDRQKETDARLRRHWQNIAAWYALHAVELEPKNAEAWALQAEIYQRLGRKDEAAQAVARAIELDPSRADGTSPNARYLQALALAQEHKWAEADESFAKALDGLAVEAAKSAGVPLIGVLSNLAPVRASAGYRELKLPAPIPGTFENFDATPECQLPPGWTAQHERIDAQPLASAEARLDLSESNVFDDWTTIAWDRVIASPTANGAPFFRTRLLARGEQERVNEFSPPLLLQGRFLFALSAERRASGVQRLLTPGYDCTGRSHVHVAFYSAMEQGGEAITALEYTVDEGNSWLPVNYRLNSPYVVLDAAGKLDASATFTKPKPDAPLYFDSGGRPRGTTFGDFIGAPVNRALDPYVQGMRRNFIAEGKRVEVFRLEAADGKPHVQLRFLQAGRFGWYWGLDELGLYELPAEPVTKLDTVERTKDAGFLMNLAWTIGFGTGARLDPSADPNEQFSESFAGDKSSPSAAAAEASTEALKRRALDALLVARRALALSPREPSALGRLAAIAVRAGELDLAGATFRDLAAIEPLHRYSALGLLSYYRAMALALESSGESQAATVLDELCHTLELAALGRADRQTLERLAKAGLGAENQILLPRGSEWAYLDDGTDPGPSWVDPNFDDTVWPSGPARLGYGNDGERTVVGFGPNARDKHITTYFRTTFNVADPGRFAQLKLSVARDDGVVVYLNGQEVARDNMPAGPIGPQTTASATVNDQDERRLIPFDITAALRPGNNVIAAEIHQQGATSSDLGFDLELEGLGALKEPARDADALEAIEARFGIRTELRCALWTARAAHARLAGDLERAASSLERAARLGAENPSVLYERALLQLARGDSDAAHTSWRAAAQATIALKTGPRSSYTLLLPPVLKTVLEPITQPTGIALAAAAIRLQLVTSQTRDSEYRWLLSWSESLDRDGREARLQRAEAALAFGKTDAALTAAEAALSAGPPP
ncbi:MAG TPA: AAA family ATPase, partial [Planctomycetota bacterium]|nr:AAA family ATPase [Planctomycetota bacterium]